MVKKKSYSDKEKLYINNRHVDIFNKTLEGIDIILDGVLYNDTVEKSIICVSMLSLSLVAIAELGIES